MSKRHFNISIAKAKKDSGVDKIMKEAFKTHSESRIDIEKADALFHSHSVLYPNNFQDKRYLTKENAMQSLTKIFDSWELDLTDKQEKDFKKRRFNTVWKAMEQDGKLN